MKRNEIDSVLKRLITDEEKWIALITTLAGKYEATQKTPKAEIYQKKIVLSVC